MTSLRRRLLVGTGAGTVTILLLAGIGLHTMMSASLLGEFDRALVERATALSAFVEQLGDQMLLEFTEDEMREFQKTRRPEYFQVWRKDGTIVGKSPLLGATNLPLEQASVGSPTIRAADLPADTTGRMVTTNFMPRLDDESPPSTRREYITLALARDTADISSALAQLRMLLIVVGLAATLASAGLLAWLVRVGLRPVDQLARRIGDIDVTRLSAKINPAESPSELLGVVHRLNELLTRLDTAFHREKTMTANVAHELRTPLAGIRSTLEVALSRERDAAASREVMTDCLEICTQTQRLIENLLVMARMEAGKEPTRTVPTDVEALLRRAWKPHDESVRKREVRVEWELSPDSHAETDPEHLLVVFANVLENAAQYVDPGGTITIHTHRRDAKLHVLVSNTGSTLSKADLSRVFEPFWRGDASRAATGTHCGLGLPLCKTVLDRLGGSIQVESTDAGVFVARATLGARLE